MDTPQWIRVDGDRLVDGAGRPVTLTGIGLGGWLNLENFITGHPGTETQMRQAMRRALGAEGYRRFFDRFLTVFFDDADARYLADLGLNTLRIPFHHRHLATDEQPFTLLPDAFGHLDRVVDACARAGLTTILDLHALPGSQNQHWHSDNATHHAAFWDQRQFQDRVVWLWEAIADHYRDNPYVAGYNPVNEPADPTGERIGPFYARLERAIRAVDPRHVLFLDGNRYASDFSAFTDPLPNTVYATHDYALPGIAADGVYPGTTRGEYVDAGVLKQTFLRRTEYMRRTGTPVWIGEFGPIYTGDPHRDAARDQLLRDQLAIYRANGASWSLWTYKDIGVQGLVVTAADCAWLRRTAAVRAKKARLGVDAWGGNDSGVRHLLDPIEQLFDEEFPDFHPYPWGRASWIQLLVRNIMLAEPLVEEFGRCFDGVSPDEAEALADGFAFAHCVPRATLAATLREHAGANPRQ